MKAKPIVKLWEQRLILDFFGSVLESDFREQNVWASADRFKSANIDGKSKNKLEAIYY